jgi:hypothetical protein
MDDLERLLIESACTRLVHEYCRRIDFGEGGRVAELFTDDGVWEGAGSPMRGTPAIRDGFAPLERSGAPLMRHLVTNVTIDVVDPDTATGLTYWINYRGKRSADDTGPVPSGPPRFAGEYRDRFVRTPDGWRFAHRQASVTFANPPATAG